MMSGDPLLHVPCEEADEQKGQAGNAKAIPVMLISSLGLCLYAGYQIVRDPSLSIGWKALVICAGAPVLFVLIFLLVAMWKAA